MKDKSFHTSYTGPRRDILNLISKDAKTVLDVGCATGETGRALRESRPRVEVTGIEVDEKMAQVALERLDRIIVGDIEELNLDDYFPGRYFDCILFSDILEHLRDPWETLKRGVEHLKHNGTIVASIPNVRHYTTILNLVIGGYWPHRDRGIHDDTHLRFFALRNIEELFRSAGLRIEEVKRKYRILERPHRINDLGKYLAVGLFPLKEFLVFHYLVIGRKLDK